MPVALLYSGPAINVVTIMVTALVLGLALGNGKGLVSTQTEPGHGQ
jgi:hypothetical protein